MLTRLRKIFQQAAPAEVGENARCAAQMRISEANLLEAWNRPYLQLPDRLLAVQQPRTTDADGAPEMPELAIPLGEYRPN